MVTVRLTANAFGRAGTSLLSVGLILITMVVVMAVLVVTMLVLVLMVMVLIARRSRNGTADSARAELGDVAFAVIV